MKEILVEKFDGAIMSAIVGERVTLDEAKAVQLAADIDDRSAALKAKADRADALNDELVRLTAEIDTATPALDADTAEAKTLILNFVKLYRKNSIAVPTTLSAFVADIDTPDESAPAPSDNAPVLANTPVAE